MNDQQILTILPGVYDGLGASIARHVGAKAVYASGGAIARSFGLPDLGLVSMTEMASRLESIVCASTVLHGTRATVIPSTFGGWSKCLRPLVSGYILRAELPKTLRTPRRKVANFEFDVRKNQFRSESSASG